MPLCCSFLGKVPPIGGFRILRSFLPPTLLRGGICAFCTSAILRRYADYRKAREDMKELLTAKANIDRILELDKEQEEANERREQEAEQR